MRTSTRILATCAAALAVCLAFGAASSEAQCLITGPTSVCPGNAIDLCGPSRDNAFWFWQGPGGTGYFGQCITITDPGSYQLKIEDMFSGVWTDSCTVVVLPGAAPPPVTGPATTCSGTPVSWCGPAGSFEYAWSGPGGFAATTACVSVSDAGDYALKVRPMPDGCWTDSTLKTLAVTDCTVPSTNCPRSAAWWADQVQHGWGDSRRGLVRTSQIAACVDENDSFFNWSSPADGLRRTLLPQGRTLRMTAVREIAAVQANVCAGAVGLVTNQAAPVALDPSTPVSLPGVSGTVSDWLARADAQLARLAARPEHTAATNAAYCALIVVAWDINHGVGIGPTCSRREALDRSVPAGAGDASDTVAGDPEPLATLLLDGDSSPLEFGALAPNPFTSTTTLAYAVSTAGPSEISIGVYDVSGRLVRELARGTFAPGRYEARWDGRTSAGSPARSGTYFILGRIGGERVQTRVALVR